MAIGARLLRMKEAAKDRPPLEPDYVDDQEFKPTPVFRPALAPVALEKVFSKDMKIRSAVAENNYGLDCETFLIQPGRQVPRLVVTGYQYADGSQFVVTGKRGDPSVHARAFLAFTDKIVARALNRTAIGTAVAMNTVDRVQNVFDGGLLVNQNIPFDFTAIAEDAHQCDIVMGLVGKKNSFFEQVMLRIFEMLDLHLVEDTMLRERLIDLAEGTLGKDYGALSKDGNPRRKKYNLKEMARVYLGVDLDKLTYRMGYSRYFLCDIEEYDEGARKYLTEDVESALHVAARQNERAQLHGLPPNTRIPNSAEQSKAAFAFQLMSAWGVRTNLSKVQQLEADLDLHERRLFNVLRETGMVHTTGPRVGSRNMKRTYELVRAAYEEKGLAVPLTDGGKSGNRKVSTSGAVLEEIAMLQLKGRLKEEKEDFDKDGHLDETELFKNPLYAYSVYVSIQKLKNTYLPVLFQGTRHPINARYETILETGRVSCYSPNLTNLPRGGVKTLLQRLQARVRECYVPRPGYVFCSVDYNTLELCTLAQVCLWMLGQSRLAEVINAGVDPHLLMAAEQFLHITYEEAERRKKEKEVADMRQMVKSANFGLPGGLGPFTLIEYAKNNYSVYLTFEEAKALKEKWLAQWPEMREYFRRISQMMKGVDDYGQSIGDIEQFVSGRIRGRVRYTAAANSFFQGLAADGAKRALYEMQKQCYLLDGSMYGSRPVVFVHDEIIAEHPEKYAAERAQLQADLMVRVMQEICPDVKIRAEPALMEAWYKGAEAVYSRSGKLIPWDPNVKYAKDPASGKMMPVETSFKGSSASA